LTAQEVNYLKQNLSRILKIGAEFEFNLPEEKTGTCKGVSFTCPCVHYGSDTRDCWKGCVNEASCSTTPGMYKCENRTDRCKPEDCAECDKYSFKCIGELCGNRIVPCIACDDFEMQCATCVHRYDPNKNPDAIRQSCVQTFNPSGSYGVVSKSGVHSIVTDGSLLGQKGMEIITNGRRVNYWEFYQMSKDIINTAMARGGYSNERCSIHMHGLAAYYNRGDGGSPASELERSVPEIVLANLHQLFRKYQNAITWMTTGLGDPTHLTRWEKFRVSMLPISAVTKPMRKVVQDVQSHCGGNKYSWTNYKFCKFDADGDVSRLHVEIRAMDGLLAPSAVSAMACLYYALFIKAVELSRYGILKIGTKEEYEKAQEVKEALLNNCSDWQDGNKYGRFSDTSKLSKYTDILVSESFDLIAQVKHILASVGPAYDVLEKLAEAPCSLRLCDGKSWQQIEKELKVELTEEGQFEFQLNRIIDTRKIVSKETQSSWIAAVAEEMYIAEDSDIEVESLDEMQDKLSIYIDGKQSDGEMIWAQKIGSMISI
jgi:hypothetical protein